MMTAQPLEIRMARLEGSYEQVADRLNGIEMRLDHLDTKIDSARDQLSAKIDGVRDVLDTKSDSLRDYLHTTMDAHFRWTIATMVALVAALGAFLHVVH